MTNHHHSLAGALVGLRYQAELFQEHPGSEELRTTLRDAMATAKTELSLPLQPGSEVDQWRIIVRRYVKGAKLAMDTRNESLNLGAIRDASRLLLRLLTPTERHH